jgi:hypothetical protein
MIFAQMLCASCSTANWQFKQSALVCEYLLDARAPLRPYLTLDIKISSQIEQALLAEFFTDMHRVD